MSLPSTVEPRVPVDGGITLVVDPEDSMACATAVTNLASLPNGRVVCHPTPGGSPSWLACDLLLALGKRFDALRAEKVWAQAWDLAGVWLRAEGIEHLFVSRAHRLKVGALERLRELQLRTGIRLWLVSSCAGLTTAQQQALNQLHFETMSRKVFLQRWRRVIRASRPLQSSTARDAFPVVPVADFAVFRASCRRLLDTASFAVVDRTFVAALDETLRWLSPQRVIREQFRSIELELDQLDEEIPRTQYVMERRLQVRKELDRAWYRFECDARSQLNTLVAVSSSAWETLVRLRAAQAAYFRFGLLLDVRVPPQALRGATEFGSTFDADMADRLRGLCTPSLTAAATLALALNLGPNALSTLRVGEVTATGTVLELPDGERHVLPAHTLALVRAQQIHRRDQGAGEDDTLFCARDGGPAGGVMLRRLLQLVGRRLAMSIPSATSPVVLSLSWRVGHRLTLTRLPVYPLAARRWTSA